MLCWAESCICMPRGMSVSSSSTERNGFSRDSEKLISRRQFCDFMELGVTNAMTMAEPSRCWAMSSGHSLPGAMPSSYQKR